MAVPGSFQGITTASGEAELHIQLTYFSFITMTTVGFGDITPKGDAARSFSMAEAVMGQIYLTVLIADLVGKRVAQMLSTDGRGSACEGVFTVARSGRFARRRFPGRKPRPRQSALVAEPIAKSPAKN